MSKDWFTEIIADYSAKQRAELEARDPFPPEDGPARWAWYKRRNRENLKRLGYVRMEVQMPPSLYKRLLPHLTPYCLHHHAPRGSELVRFLEDLEIVEDGLK